MADRNGVRDASASKQPFHSQPLLSRLLYGTAVFLVQHLVVWPAMTYRHWQMDRARPDTYPTLIKTYQPRPRLPVRVYFPKAYDRQSAQTLPQPLPLLFTIHGGGFVLGDPSDTDEWNSIFANENQALVVALNYAKAPANPFPGPLADLEAQVRAVFDDDELRPFIDSTRVGMVGFSAGGNLALAISQVAAVRARLTAGVVPIYPVLDFSLGPAHKAATRRYKPDLGGARGRTRDPFVRIAGAFDWAYIPAGQDTRDPLLSPAFVDRAALPPRIWLVACELDMLGHEAWRLACRLAGRACPRPDDKIGQETPEASARPGALITAGDDRFAWVHKEAGGGEVRWLCVPDALHGFDMPSGMGEDERTLEDGRLKRDEIIRQAGRWLFVPS